MHGYEWPINCTRTRKGPAEQLSSSSAASSVGRGTGEGTDTLSMGASQKLPGRFTSHVLRPLVDALLHTGAAPVERAAEREAVTSLFARNCRPTKAEYGYEEEAEDGLVCMFAAQSKAARSHVAPGGEFWLLLTTRVRV